MVMVIDVSRWQTGINYPVLAKQIDGVILRAAYGIWKDTMFDEHYKAFSALKVPIGAYHYIIGNQTPHDQAHAFSEIIKQNGGEFALGIWNDIEDTRPDTALDRNDVLEYHKQVERLTDRQMDVYTSASKWDAIMGSKVLSSKKLWIANYGVSVPRMPKTGGWQSWWLWQYTDRGRLDGYQTSLDLNKFIGSREEYYEWVGIEDTEPELGDVTYVIEMLGNMRVHKKPDGISPIEGVYVRTGETYNTRNMRHGWYEIKVGGVVGWILGTTRWTRISVVDGEPDEPEAPFLTMQEKVNKLWDAHPELHHIGQINIPMFSQKNSRWANNKLGTSNTTIGDYGCLITATAMVLKYFGKDTDPGRLNKDLVKANGYENGNLLRYDAITTIYSDIVVDWDLFLNNPDNETIDSVLERGLLPIVQVDFDTTTHALEQHWVVIIGKDSAGYKIIDPIDGTTTYLSRYGNKTYRMVVFVKQT